MLIFHVYDSLGVITSLLHHVRNAMNLPYVSILCLLQKANLNPRARHSASQIAASSSLPTCSLWVGLQAIDLAVHTVPQCWLVKSYSDTLNVTVTNLPRIYWSITITYTAHWHCRKRLYSKYVPDFPFTHYLVLIVLFRCCVSYSTVCWYLH